MIFTTRFAALAALVLLAAGLFFGLHGGDSLAFGDVVQRVRDARTMTCQLTVTPAGRPAMKSKALFLGSRAMRTETNTAATVVDSDKKTMMVLDLPHRTAMVARTGNVNQAGTPPAAGDNWFDQLKKIDAKSGKPIGVGQVAGRTARGFKVVERAGEYTIWADAKTGAPLRVEMSVRVAGSEMAVVMEQIIFDADLPESLFSVEPPPGYSVQKTMAASGEQDLVAFLRDYANRTGEYPTSLGDWTKAYEAVLPKESHQKADPAALNVILEGGRAASFLGSLPKDADWHYVGNSVRPGEPKVLFWYRPEKSQQYRAVYGDLRIADVNGSDVPK